MGPQETKVYIAFLIAAAVIGVILIYFIVTILRQQKSNLALHHAKIQAEIITLEKERSRVARDLHDDLAPLLSAVKYNVNSFEFTNTEDQDILNKCNDMLDTMIGRIREISNDLLPEALLRKGLMQAVEESARRIQLRTGLHIEFRGDRNAEIPFEKAVNIYRIIQEVLHNTVKHAQAGKLTIEMKQDESTLFIVAEDDGKGFDYPSETKEFSGLGLRSMLSRADVLSARMFLDSKEGRGTHYVFEIPMPRML